MNRDERAALEARLRKRIRDVPDFPKPGIVFKDIAPLLADRSAFAEACTAMAAAYREAHVTHLAAIESRGFLFAGAIALQLNAGIIPIRKPGKLPYHRVREEYALEYGTDALEMHIDAVTADARVLLIDDVLATGGTARATRQLIARQGATVVGGAFLIELSFLGGRALLPDLRVESLLSY